MSFASGQESDVDEETSLSSGLSEDPPNKSPQNNSFNEQATQTNEQDWDHKVIEAILNALPMKHQQGDSIRSFEDWLKWAKDFVLTEVKMKDIWPTSWSETEEILKRVGYESPNAPLYLHEQTAS